MILAQVLLQVITAREAVLASACAAFLGAIHVAPLVLRPIVSADVGLARKVPERLAGCVTTVAVGAKRLGGDDCRMRRRGSFDQEPVLG